MTDTTIRPLAKTDEAEWRRLWTDYLTFYKTSVPEEVYATTWKRLFDDGEYEPNGLIAEVDGKPVGLVHYMLHRTCWTVGNNCYLQDLYADPAVRGKGIGRALIEAVYEKADEAGAANVYWMTQDFNETARKLYDRIAKLTPFIKYQRS
ncbi:GNAT family N-acetyltransferase [Nitratireductor sp. L1-7-SE]|uniref:GNAT family N-acetyltransferase n=1 Tax=Nitratireductor rhodophyticola TaxID=2854036 RepID=A0ABS7R532_9HYPH|nr:GNAT family N-acetyltransferase [Nitratireductor rhodophyticola]MBY8916031.1 GNAT family N-acetyltransferase [Nitratireductor rhodophyticola]MBY8921394.1 GNAT family N-acetyltransferase [Nitratireductor rhodophyticola]